MEGVSYYSSSKTHYHATLYGAQVKSPAKDLAGKGQLRSHRRHPAKRSLHSSLAPSLCTEVGIDCSRQAWTTLNYSSMAVGSRAERLKDMPI